MMQHNCRKQFLRETNGMKVNLNGDNMPPHSSQPHKP